MRLVLLHNSQRVAASPPNNAFAHLARKLGTLRRGDAHLCAAVDGQAGGGTPQQLHHTQVLMMRADDGTMLW